MHTQYNKYTYGSICEREEGMRIRDEVDKFESGRSGGQQLQEIEKWYLYFKGDRCHLDLNALYLRCSAAKFVNTVQLHLCGCWLSVSPIIQIDLAPSGKCVENSAKLTCLETTD